MRRFVMLQLACLILIGAQLSAPEARAADCCTVSPLPMCDDPLVMFCVCVLDLNCCAFGWDATCVAEVTLLGCGSCGGGCQPNCAGKQCGSDGCGGTCGQCFGNNICQNGICVPNCTPNCAGKQCGDDGCGGMCGSCQVNYACVAGICQANCQPQCAGKQCGPDGCNGTCGSCGFGEICNNGMCESACEPDCVGKQCGSNNCGGMCGSCGFDQACNGEGHCIPLCEKQCQGKECGDDSCGGSCGDCPVNSECNDALCSVPCLPDCLNRECGNNGCGGQCGSCAADFVCTIHGVCLPEDEADGVLLDGDKDGYSQSWNGGADASGIGHVTDCPPGNALLYGICVEADQTADSGAADSGCGACNRPASAALLLLLGLLLCYLVARRFRPSRA
jgi:hypothetical protein